MTFYRKYLKYKSKYLSLSNQIGGEKSDTILIYIVGIGAEEKVNPRDYICSFLSQRAIYNKLGISDNRIHYIFGGEMPNDTTFTCTGNVAGLYKLPSVWKTDVSMYNNFPLPYGINTIYVNDETNIVTEIQKILEKYCNQNTPIILLYDGYGDKSEKLPLCKNKYISVDNIIEAFKNFGENNKLFILSQCGYSNFMEQLQTKKIRHISLYARAYEGLCGSTLSQYIAKSIDNKYVTSFDQLGPQNQDSKVPVLVWSYPAPLQHDTTIKTFFQPKVHKVTLDKINSVMNKYIKIFNSKGNICYVPELHRAENSIILSFKDKWNQWKIIRGDKDKFRIETSQLVPNKDPLYAPAYAYIAGYNYNEGTVALYNISQYRDHSEWMFEYDASDDSYYIYQMVNNKYYYLSANQKGEIYLNNDKLNNEFGKWKISPV
jgi:hypothetical protein